MKRFLFLSLLHFFFAPVFAQTLRPGSAAPKLNVGSWVKGEPVKELHPDSTYVIEFWATWCGPCIQAIPHLTELANRFQNKVKFIGVSVAETNTAQVKPFVQRMGDKMDYSVAIDQQTSPTAREGYMTKHWLEAAGLNGIPATFLVHKNEIAWIGHPMQLDSTLQQVIAGTWNIKKFSREYREQRQMEAAVNARMSDLNNRLKLHSKRGNKNGFYKALTDQLEFVSEHPEAGGWSEVNSHIWYWLADPQAEALPAAMKDPAFGIQWMEKLIARPEGNDAAFFDTLAWLYHHAGDHQKAIQFEEKALAMLDPNDPSRKDMESTLEIFRKSRQ